MDIATKLNILLLTFQQNFIKTKTNILILRDEEDQVEESLIRIMMKKWYVFVQNGPKYVVWFGSGDPDNENYFSTL